MKKSIFYLFIAAFCFAVISCNNESGKTNDSENQTNEESVIEEQEEISPDELARLTPADVDENTPIPVAELNKAFFEWQDVEVTIAGYVRMYLDSDDLKENFQIVGTPESTDYLFNCTFAETPEGTINSDDVIIVKGKISGSSYSGIKLMNCTFVGINEDYTEEKDLSPYRMPKEPMFAQNLFDVYNSWTDVEVTVIGKYYSTTTSTLNDGVIWRVDLSDPESGKKMIGCRTITEPDSDFLKDNREDVVIKGIIKGESFSAVLMEECEIQ